MPRTTEITNSESIIDSRDVIRRIEALEENIQDAADADPPEAPDADEVEELAKLKKLASQCEGYGDWAHGEALISEDHFEDYARQLAEDIGALRDDAKWPATCIDWKQAAEELQQDYTQVDFDGTTYFMRS